MTSEILSMEDERAAKRQLFDQLAKKAAKGADLDLLHDAVDDAYEERKAETDAAREAREAAEFAKLI